MKKTFLLLASIVMILAVVSCKKEKCSYYNDIMTYYDQSVETWTQQCQQGVISDTALQYQLNKIERERAGLQKQYKDCVEN